MIRYNEYHEKFNFHDTHFNVCDYEGDIMVTKYEDDWYSSHMYKLTEANPNATVETWGDQKENQGYVPLGYIVHLNNMLFYFDRDGEAVKIRKEME